LLGFPTIESRYMWRNPHHPVTTINSKCKRKLA